MGNAAFCAEPSRAAGPLKERRLVRRFFLASYASFPGAAAAELDAIVPAELIEPTEREGAHGRSLSLLTVSGGSTQGRGLARPSSRDCGELC